jgi:hypothetical protein
MNELAPALQAGYIIFGVTAGIIGLAFWYFVYSTEEAAAQFSHKEYDIKISRSIWIYYNSFVTSIAFLMLYLLQYYGQGFATKPNLSIIIWLRWLFYAAMVYETTHLLTKVMAYHDNAPTKKEVAGGDPQSHTTVRASYLAGLLIFGASISQARETEIIWITFSIAFFLVAVVSLFFPHDKIWGRSYLNVRDIVYSQSSTWDVIWHSLPDKNRENSIVVWAFVYRFVLFLQWIVSYLGLVVTWCLADGNEFTSVLDLRQTVIAFLVFDAIFVVPFQLLLACLTFKNVVKKVTATDKVTGQVHFASQPSALLNSAVTTQHMDDWS